MSDDDPAAELRRANVKLYFQLAELFEGYAERVEAATTEDQRLAIAANLRRTATFYREMIAKRRTN